jgi:homoserine/homoserine lactone efflux protein
MTATQWSLYLGLLVLSTASPGPAVLLSVSNALSLGLRASALSSLGNISGLACLSAAAFVGVGSVQRASPAVFGLLKLAGAAYLVYLGVRRWQAPDGTLSPAAAPAPRGRAAAGLWGQGALVALTNPKGLLFFGALYPQFIQPAAPLLPQFLQLTVPLVLCSFTALMVYATLARRLQRHFAGQPGRGRFARRASGAAFILLGLALGLS